MLLDLKTCAAMLRDKLDFQDVAICLNAAEMHIDLVAAHACSSLVLMYALHFCDCVGRFCLGPVLDFECQEPISFRGDFLTFCQSSVIAEGILQDKWAFR